MTAGRELSLLQPGPHRSGRHPGNPQSSVTFERSPAVPRGRATVAGVRGGPSEQPAPSLYCVSATSKRDILVFGIFGPATGSHRADDGKRDSRLSKAAGKLGA